MAILLLLIVQSFKQMWGLLLNRTLLKRNYKTNDLSPRINLGSFWHYKSHVFMIFFHCIWFLWQYKGTSYLCCSSLWSEPGIVKTSSCPWNKRITWPPRRYPVGEKGKLLTRAGTYSSTALFVWTRYKDTFLVITWNQTVHIKKIHKTEFAIFKHF